jgi:hypothetical protein
MKTLIITSIIGLLFAGSSNCDPKTNQPAKAPIIPANALKIEVQALGTPIGRFVKVKVDAYDQYGSHGMNFNTGHPYPFEEFQRTPFTHPIYYEPGIVLTVFIEVLAADDEDINVIGCKIFDNGREIKEAARVLAIPPDPAGALVKCVYHQLT